MRLRSSPSPSHVPFIVLTIALGACGGRTTDPSAIDGGDGREGGDPGCPDDLGASVAEIASTPRGDRESELIALWLGTRIVAEQATYDRVARDLGAMRSAHPEFAAIHVRQPFSESIRVVADRATIESVRGGTYHGWDCLDARYVVTDRRDYAFATDGPVGFVTLVFKGLYAPDRLACRYLTAPNVTRVLAVDESIGDGPALFAWREDAVFHYVFDDAGGDCPLGCTTHDAKHFTTTPDGAVTLSDTFKTIDYGTPLPAWMNHRWYKADGCLTR